MNDTTVATLDTQSIIGITIPVVLLLISELMPFIPNRYNGLIHTIYIVLKEVYREILL
jgi:hypothetical protein